MWEKEGLWVKGRHEESNSMGQSCGASWRQSVSPIHLVILSPGRLNLDMILITLIVTHKKEGVCGKEG